MGEHMDLVAMGATGLSGWQRKAARPLARAVAGRTRLNEEQVLASLGAMLLVMTAVGFFRTVLTVVRAGRGGDRAALQA